MFRWDGRTAGHGAILPHQSSLRFKQCRVKRWVVYDLLQNHARDCTLRTFVSFGYRKIYYFRWWVRGSMKRQIFPSLVRLFQDFGGSTRIYDTTVNSLSSKDRKVGHEGRDSIPRWPLWSWLVFGGRTVRRRSRKSRWSSKPCMSVLHIPPVLKSLLTYAW